MSVFNWRATSGLFIVSVIFPSWFSPGYFDLKVPSGNSYKIISRGQMHFTESKETSFIITYQPERATDDIDIANDAIDLAGAAQSDPSLDGYNSLIISANIADKKIGFITKSHRINSLFKRGSNMIWIKVSDKTSPPASIEGGSSRFELENEYAKTSKALMRKDPQVVFDQMALSYQHTLADGSIRNREQENESNIRVVNVAQLEAYEFVVTDVHLQGSKATVIESSSAVVVPDKQTLRKKRRVIMQSQDIWQKTSDGWKIENSKDLSERFIEIN